MKVALTTAAALAALSLPSMVSAAAGTSYNVFHRISTFDSTPDWTLRSTLDLTSPNASYALSNILTPSQVADLKQQAYSEEARELWYQIGISSSTDKIELQTSIRLCHLRQSHPDLASIDDELVLTTRSSSPLLTVTGMSYRVRDITLDSSLCPVRSPAKLAQVKENARRERQRQLARRSNRGVKLPPAPTPELAFETKVEVRKATAAPKVALVQARPTNENGTVKEPEPEKTFLQKYWYYLIPVAIMLLIPPGEDDKPPTTTTGGAPATLGAGAKQLK